MRSTRTRRDDTEKTIQSAARAAVRGACGRSIESVAMSEHGERSGKASATFPKSARVRKQADFDRVHRAQAYAADDVLVVRGTRNGLAQSRLGLSVSRKVGNAVQRNRWKRLIREAFRTSRTDLPGGIDFVARPRKGAVADLAAIQASLPQLCRRVARRAAKERS